MCMFGRASHLRKGKVQVRETVRGNLTRRDLVTSSVSNIGGLIVGDTTAAGGAASAAARRRADNTTGSESSLTVRSAEFIGAAMGVVNLLKRESAIGQDVRVE